MNFTLSRALVRHALLLALLSFPGAVATAFANAAVGDVIQDKVLATAEGGQEHLLGDAEANVFIFLKPGQPHSDTLARELPGLQRQTAGKAARWVVVVSDRTAGAALKEFHPGVPVLIDAGDELYGRLGVALEPAFGLADKRHRLLAYQPYTKVNFLEVMRARVRHALKEIDDAALARVLTPPRAETGGAEAAAHRRYQLARKLADAGQYAKALENITISLEKNDRVAESHALRGRILAALGDREAARAAYARALELDPSDEAARRARDALAQAMPARSK